MNLNDFDLPRKNGLKIFFSPSGMCGLIQKSISFKFHSNVALISCIGWIPSAESRRQKKYISLSMGKSRCEVTIEGQVGIPSAKSRRHERVH